MKVTYQENVPLSLINEDDLEFQPRLDYDEAMLKAGPGEVSLSDRIGYGARSRLVQMCQGNFVDMAGPDLR